MVRLFLVVFLFSGWASGAEPNLARMGKAISEFNSGNLEAAEQEFKSLVSEPNLFSEYQHFYLSQIYQKMKKYDQEIYHLGSLLKLSPNIQLKRAALTREAELLLSGNQFKKAKSLVAKIEKSSRRTSEHERIVAVLARAEKAIGRGSKYCYWLNVLYGRYPSSSVTQAFGPDIETAGCQAKGRLKQNQSDTLEIMLSNYNQQSSGANYLMNLAYLLSKKREYSASVWVFDQVHQKFPKSGIAKRALFQAAFTSYQSGDYDGATRRFQFLIERPLGVSLSQDAKWYIAWIQYLKGNYEVASGLFQDLIHQNQRLRRGKIPDDRFRYWQGMSAYRLGRYTDARAIFYRISQDYVLSYYSTLSRYRLAQLKTRGYGLSLQQSNFGNGFLHAGDSLPPDTSDAPATEGEREELWSLGIFQEPADEEVVTDDSEAQSDEGEEDDSEELTEVFKAPFFVSRFERAQGLAQLGLVEWAKWDLYDIERKTSNKEYLKHLMREYAAIGKYDRAAIISQTRFSSQRMNASSGETRQLWQYAYPRAFEESVSRYSKSYEVPDSFVWSIMRAESQFSEKVISPVGALGLMQVMPFTGNKVASLMGEDSFTPEQLLIPDTAIKIGTRYLKGLLRQFDNNIVLSAASYNAGPHRVKSWLANFGNVELDEFVDHIPYFETRNYVKKVVANYQIYSLLYNGNPNGLSDLTEPIKVKFVNPEGFETWESF